MEDLFDQLNRIYGEQTSNCSEICRKIVFALFAIIWALSYSQGELKFTVYSIIVSILLVIYLIIDTLQYFLTAYSYRKHFYAIQKAKTEGISNNLIASKELEKRKSINDRSFRLMVLKVSLLPFIFIVLIITLIDKL